MDCRPGGIAVFAIFRFDLLRLELRKAGRRIRLETKPAQILALLLERTGELVTREELRASLWPDDVHLDFEHALNKSIHKLRSALSDNHAEPRFVETISRRGYRFIAPVEFVPQVANDPRGLRPSTIAALDLSTTPVVSVAPSPPMAVSSSPADTTAAQGLAGFRRKWLAPSLRNQTFLVIAATLAAVVLLVIANSSFATFWDKHRAKPARRSLAVLGFRNLSHDPKEAWLSTAFSEWLSVDLASGEQLRLVSSQDSANAVSQLDPLDGSSLSPQNLNKLRKLLGADLAVSGAYATAGSSGDQIRLDLVLQSTSTGETIQSLSFVGDRPHILELAREAGSGLRDALHLAAPSPLGLGGARASLPSGPDAARFYSEGLQHLRAFDAATALQLFSEAEKRDPLHAMTHFGMASAYTLLGRSVEALQEAKKALDLSASLPREHLLVIRGQYHEALQDWNSAAEDYAALFRFFPDEIDYGLRLAAVQISSSRMAAALETLGSLRQLPPPMRDDPRIDLTEAAVAAALSDYPRQRQAAQMAADKGARQGSSLVVARAQISEGEALRALGQYKAALDLWQSAQKTFADARNLSGVAQTLNREASVFWKLDQLAEAEERYQQSIEISRSLGDQSSLAAALAGLGEITLYEDQPARARGYLDEALATYHRIGNAKEEGYTLSLLGDFEMINKHLASARELYEQALLLSRQAGDNSRVAGRLMDLGIVYTWQGALSSAADQLDESVRLSSKLGEKSRLFHALNRLGVVRLYQGRLRDAQSLLEQSIAIATEIGDKSTAWQPRTDLAWVLIELGQPAESERVAWQSLDEHSHDSAPFSWLRIGFAQCAQAKFTECRKSYSNALYFPAHLSESDFEVNLQLLRAQILTGENKLDEAKREILKAGQVSDRVGFVTEQLKVRLALGTLEMQAGQSAQGRQLLQSLEQEASKRGFPLFADRARSVLAAPISAARVRSRAEHQFERYLTPRR